MWLPMLLTGLVFAIGVASLTYALYLAGVNGE